jgi:hypothetical protein
MLHPNTHAYRLLIFKERFAYVCLPFCCRRQQRRTQLWHYFDKVRKSFGKKVEKDSLALGASPCLPRAQALSKPAQGAVGR